MLRVSLLLLILAQSAVGLQSKDLQVRISGFETEGARMMRLLDACERQIRSHLPRDQQRERMWITIRQDDGFAVGVEPSLVVRLPAGQDAWRVVPALMRASLYRYAPRDVEPYPLPEEVADWLVAALTRELLTEGRNVAPIRFLPVVRLSERRPSIADIANNPVSPRDTVLFRAYCQRAHALLLVAEQSHPRFLSEIIATTGLVGQPVALTARALKLELPSLQLWFQSQFEGALYDLFRPYSYSETEHRRALALSVSLPDEEGKPDWVALPAALEHQAYVPPTREELERRRRELLTLLARSPWLLRERLNEDINVLQDLEENRLRSFQRKARRAEQAFRDAHARGVAAQALLRESAQARSFRALAAMLVARESRAAITEFESEVSAFLDRVSASHY